jgi:acyl transferase domain-containing protein
VGEADAGLAAGVNLALLYVNTSVICAIGALSPVGRCKALDAAADGYGRGEGCGVFVIGGGGGSGGDAYSFAAVPTPPTAMLVMVASAVNQDGRSSALTAPHGPSQQVLLTDIAREEAEAEADRGGLGLVGSRFVAMHGTGTGLGDPIETGALARSALGVAGYWGGEGGGGDTGPRVLLGAPKAHYGHTEGAAGVAGLLAAAGHLASGEAPPVKHLRNLNPFVASALEAAAGSSLSAPRTRGAAPTTASPSPSSTSFSFSSSASAATSSFGMSGVNAHAVVRVGEHPKSMHSAGGRSWPRTWTREAQRFAYYPRPHPLLGGWCVVSGGGGGAVDEEVFQLELDTARPSYLRDHQVMGGE